MLPLTCGSTLPASPAFLKRNSRQNLFVQHPHEPVCFLETRVDGLEALIDPLEPLIDRLKPPIDSRPP